MAISITLFTPKGLWTSENGPVFTDEQSHLLLKPSLAFRRAGRRPTLLFHRPVPPSPRPSVTAAYAQNYTQGSDASSSSYQALPPPPDPPRVQAGKYSYELESLMNELNTLAPRASISRSMEPYKGKLTMQDFALIFREFGLQGESHRALRLFKYMQRQSWCTPTEHIYTILIGMMGREGDLAKASELFGEMYEQGVPWNVYSFTALINAYGRNGKYEHSLELLADMKEHGIEPNLITYNTVLNACAKGGLPWEGLLDLFAQMRYEGLEPDLITYNTLLSTCSARGGLVSEACMVFRTLHGARIVPDERTYLALVDACERAGQLPMAQQLLREMEETNVVPDVGGYNTLIDAYRLNGQDMLAESVLKQMQQAGCLPTSTTYSLLLEAYGENGRYEKVRETFQEMKRQGIEPDVQTYTTLVEVFCKGGHYREAVSLYGGMQEEGVAPDAKTMEGLVYACGMGGLHKEAKELNRHLRSTPASSPSLDISMSLISAYGNAGLYGDAAGVLESATSSGNPADARIFAALMDVYAKGGLAAEASQLLLYMVEKTRVAPTIDVFNGLIDAYTHAGQGKRGMELFQDVMRAGHLPNEETQAVMMRLFCSSSGGMLEEARAQFLELQAGGVMPPMGTFCSLIALSARRGRWDEVWRLLGEMGRYSGPVEHRFIASLLRGEMDDEYNWQRVDQFIDELKVEGIGRNSTTYNGVLEALWQLGAQQRAVRFLESVQARGMFPNTVHKSETLWAVDLHRLSAGGALAMLLSWLQDARTTARQGEVLPPVMAIVTRWGSQVSNDVNLDSLPVHRAVHDAIEQHLQGLPFAPATWNAGRLICSGAKLRDWLLDADMASQLDVSNRVIPEAPPPPKTKPIRLKYGNSVSSSSSSSSSEGSSSPSRVRQQ
eukprot:TRINITY_DN18561_c2_g3_i1.p1 TRINITY_DN18561_c2_g3~~TRINITY_DN18561_c2_g3_i1.p1  ORF type:complete len:894 (+),score=152.67 TRINITY_DN18561_c2_g3_i1:401-3082(+)